ncbi:MAG: EAL domain-containing protein [Leptospiraceae bacterium]|nr:EAL domain-containing protein [Leptospiraceae bacterium]MCP5500893.1 EAL domain-containing protein [Leptospiraceae bacterium]
MSSGTIHTLSDFVQKMEFEKNILNLTGESIWIIDTEGKTVYADRATADLLACSLDELLQKSVYDFIEKELFFIVRENITRKKLDTIEKHDFLFKRKDGSYVWLSISSNPIINDVGDVIGILGIVSDATRRKKIELSLRESERRIKSILENVSMIAIILDRNGNLTFINNYFSKLVNKEKESLLGLNWFKHFLPERNREDVKDLFFKNIHTGNIPSYYENEIINFQGDEFYIAWNNSIIYNPDGEIIGVASIGQDISVQREAQLRFKYLANLDPLTGLGNQRAFQKHLEEYINSMEAESDRFSLVLINLDDFSGINARYGYPVGDALLMSIGNYMKEIIPGNIVFRVGGDEFAFLVKGAHNKEESVPFLYRLLKRMKQPFEVELNSVSITASIGIASYPEDARDKNEVLKCAAFALYQAKIKGKNQFSFYMEELNLLAIERKNLEEELVGALDNNEFFLLYQPVQHIQDRRVVSYEAFIRWNNLSRHLKPATFLPVVERTGLIIRVEEWLLEHVCALLRPMENNAFSQIFSLNLSFWSLQSKSFLENISSCILKNKINPKKIQIEVSDSIFSEEKSYQKRIFQSLKQLGVSICIDNFGLGKISLIDLKKFSIDCVKLHPELLKQSFKNKDFLLTIKALLALGKAMNIDVVVKNVENQEELEFCRKEGFEYGQGFYIGVPIKL